MHNSKFLKKYILLDRFIGEEGNEGFIPDFAQQRDQFIFLKHETLLTL